jgi:DNA-binding MarR family transcriptional regulator
MDNVPRAFTDALALARLRLVKELRRELLDRGYAGFRRADGAWVRILAHEPCSLSELASIVGVSPQAVTKAADTLEERGYVVRRPDANDRRKIVLELTASGGAYAAAVDEAVDAIDERIRERVDAADLEAATRVLEAILSESF